jgi:hypothetical protein
MTGALDSFNRLGWLKFAPDAALLRWVRAVRPAALATRYDPARAEWLRCGGTWFVGVNALENDAAGAVGGSGPLEGQAMAFCRRDLGFDGALDRAQVSICYPGFPVQDAQESDASFAFRRDRDAAHLDGLHPTGPKRRRKLLEFQGFLLGIPITMADARAAPLVVWEGSHHIMGDMLRRELARSAPGDWPEIDLTTPYQAARKLAFETCKRRVIHAETGQAYLLHRMALHGVSNWQKAAKTAPEGRAILYFRPEVSRDLWLEEPLFSQVKLPVNQRGG